MLRVRFPGGIRPRRLLENGRFLLGRVLTDCKVQLSKWSGVLGYFKNSFRSWLHRLLQVARSRIDHVLYREIRAIEAPISKEGVDYTEICSKGFSRGISAREFGDGRRPEIFTPSTAIVNSGYGVWELEIPRAVRKRLVDMTLKIETVRTHGMLHTPHQGKSASVILNNEVVDKIYLVKPHPHGEDFGVDSRRPFPVFRYIKREGREAVQRVGIRIEVDDGVSWDVDRVVLEPIVLRKELRPEIAMIFGALISGIIGAFVSLWISGSSGNRVGLWPW